MWVVAPTQSHLSYGTLDTTQPLFNLRSLIFTVGRTCPPAREFVKSTDKRQIKIYLAQNRHSISGSCCQNYYSCS